MLNIFQSTESICEQIKDTQCSVKSCSEKDHLYLLPVMDKPNEYLMRPYHSSIMIITLHWESVTYSALRQKDFCFNYFR